LIDLLIDEREGVVLSWPLRWEGKKSNGIVMLCLVETLLLEVPLLRGKALDFVIHTFDVDDLAYRVAEAI
jgi:hypothetical protein